MSKKKITWTLEKRKLEQLNPYEHNPRKLTEKGMADLKKSIDKFGLAEPIIINTDNTIIGGHARYFTLLKMDAPPFVDCYVPNIKLTPKEVQELNIRLNKNIAGEFDFDILSNEFELDDLLEWGFEEKELDRGLWDDKTEEQLDEVPEVQKVAISKPGDLFLLDGKHRVMCGDSTVKADVEALMAGKRADVCFQSPPYNVGGNIGYKTKSKYINNADNRKDYADWLVKCCNIAVEYCNEVFINIQFLANNKKDLLVWLYELREIFKDIFYWKKLQVAPQFSSNVANSQMENIILFGNNNNRKWGNKSFKGNFSNYIETKSASGENKEAKIHNATFPIKLPLIFLNHGYEINTLVADYFLGCGTTLIASHQTNRICYGMEIDPIYIDVILRRYYNLYPEKRIECLTRNDFNFSDLFKIDAKN